MNSDLWETINSRLKSALPGHVYGTLVEGAKTDFSDGKPLKLSFRDEFTLEGFKNKCLPTLNNILSEMGQTDDIALQVEERRDTQTPYRFEATPVTMLFDSKHTFDSFVIGSTNQFAHAACQAVAQQPGQTYNPLFIYGPAGLGKTHLLKAIGYEVLKNNSSARALYLTCESFTTELIQAIRTDRMREFKDKFRRGCDILLLDDIHFLAGKESTQEEFFYTFNYLHESKKQIVITADRYPKDIEGLENRLQTRFEWGLVADIQPPEIETRVAILKNKADTDHIQLPNEVADFIASNVTTNIRELEGCLRRLQFHSTFSSVPISIDLAKQVLKDIAPKIKYEITPDAILRLVAVHFGVKINDLKSEKRIQKLSFPRQLCMYLLRKHLYMPFKKIGEFLGGKDHSTVMHAFEKISDLLKSDPDVVAHITRIESSLR
ncbi:MAG: chromosomal replication initiator protein DnaA [Deltaproteobacteria bacterium]|nr:chromosomal replication initiator protein DnaA [Deltaproteobacteria bacterium]MBI3293737.1 chromosomal replication initiator protein DnaA [Deltaproteobacteria bacterium]